MLKIWGRPEAVGTQGVTWTCEELSLPFRRLDPDRSAGARPAGPLADEPVAVVDERGLIMWEAGAFMRYLLEQFGPRITPLEREQADHWVDWTSSALLPSVRLLAASRLRLRGDAADEMTLRRARECVEHGAHLNEALATSPFLCGDGLTLADITAGTVVWHWVTAAPERPQLPYLYQWIERLKLRPGFERQVAKPLAYYRMVAAAQFPRAPRNATGTLAPANN
jgi:glutathione S-transferase